MVSIALAATLIGMLGTRVARRAEMVDVTGCNMAASSQSMRDEVAVIAVRENSDMLPRGNYVESHACVKALIRMDV
jgi:hypothetical protein